MKNSKKIARRWRWWWWRYAGNSKNIMLRWWWWRYIMIYYDDISWYYVTTMMAICGQFKEHYMERAWWATVRLGEHCSFPRLACHVHNCTVAQLHNCTVAFHNFSVDCIALNCTMLTANRSPHCIKIHCPMYCTISYCSLHYSAIYCLHCITPLPSALYCLHCIAMYKSKRIWFQLLLKKEEKRSAAGCKRLPSGWHTSAAARQQAWASYKNTEIQKYG